MFQDQNHAPTLGKTTRILVSAAMILAAGVAAAAPQPTGATDGVSFDNPAVGVTNITAPNNAIIDYASFNVGSGETVNFIQPGAAARVLNRINSDLPTQIDGTINANGIVYLVNPAGVTFGAGSVVDVAGLFAAAGSLAESDFINGVDRFSNLDGAVTQRGLVRAETISALIGREVVNTGTISVPNGTAIFASGSEVLIGSPRGGLMVQLDITPRTGEGGALQDGTVNAKNVSLASGDIFALALDAPRTSGPGSAGVTLAQADTDGDGDIDQTDIETAFNNYTGPVGGAGGQNQASGDTDGDGDTDDSDIGNLYALFTGPIIPPGPPTDSSQAGDLTFRLPNVITQVNLVEADLSILSGQLGIVPRQPAAQERIAQIQNRALFNDLSPTGTDTPNPDGTITIANSRLDSDVVRQALQVYRDRLEIEGVTPAERKEQIRTATNQAFDNYGSGPAAPQDFDPDRFVEFVQANNPELLDDLGALEELRRLTVAMGLSPREKTNSERTIIEGSRPAAMTYDQMKATLASAGSLNKAMIVETEADAG